MAESWLPFDEDPNSASYRRFWAYHMANPHVYEKLLEYALLAKRSGRRRWGINGIVERVRWFADFETRDPNWGSNFKINNNYAPHYARLLMEQEPELAGFFQLRALRAA